MNIILIICLEMYYCCNVEMYHYFDQRKEKKMVFL